MNMSYCRFESTSSDLNDCLEALQNDGLEGVFKEASEREKQGIKNLFETMNIMIENYGDKINDLEVD